MDVEQGRAQAAAPVLKKIMQDANSMGLKALSIQASISYGAALLATNHPDAARSELETAVSEADKLDLLLERARAEYLFGKAVSATGKPKDAQFHYQEAARILKSLSKQPGVERILDRPDLKSIYDDAVSNSGAG